MDDVKDGDEFGTSPLFVAPTAEDSATRTVDMKTKKAPTVVVDPEAPFGWMDDPTAPGGRRPKKSPGRQSKKPATAPPVKRASNKPRVAAKVIDAVPVEDRPIPQKVAELFNGLWMITGAIPVVEGKVMGRDLSVPTRRIKAQGALIRRNQEGLIAGVSNLAANSEPVGRFVDRMTAASGGGWILPAMFTLMPFVIQSATLWKGDLAELEDALAAETQAEWANLIGQATDAAQAAQGGQLAAAGAGQDASNGNG